MDWNTLSVDDKIMLMVEAYTVSWIEIAWDGRTYIKDTVEAYTASWIEIKLLVYPIRSISCRGLYSLVDWNF